MYYSCPIGIWTVGSHTYVIQATDNSGNVSTLSGSFALTPPSGTAMNALMSAANLSALPNSAKVDWLYDLGGLLNGTQSSSEKKDTSANAVDAALAAY